MLVAVSYGLECRDVAKSTHYDLSSVIYFNAKSDMIMTRSGYDPKKIV